MTPGILASKIYTKEELCLLEAVPNSCGIIIFGASGDLTFRKLFPSLFHLLQNKLLPLEFYIIGVARTPLTDSEFQQKVKESLPKNADPDLVKKFVGACSYMNGSYGDAKFYESLAKTIHQKDDAHKIPGRHLFYLSLPPSVYRDVVHNLGAAKLNGQRDDRSSWVRLIIEKPFGHSRATAKELNDEIHKVFRESQIYRIDHYQGKETVQNILMFRFANILFEPVWNRNFIDHIQITATEKLGVEHRAGYYEQSGILRDMFQNHLLQLMALTAMEPPACLEADHVRDRRNDVFTCVKSLKRQDIPRFTACGQYGAGEIDGTSVIGYRDEPGVSPSSRIPTFGAARFEIDNWRWQGVPFYLRSGKRMGSREVEIAVQFKRVPISIFKPLLADQLSPNVLKFRIQPNEGITMQFEAKHPGPKLCMSTVTMDFGYEDTFHTPPPESYARLFQDAMLGDQTLFSRADEIDESWRIIDPIIEYYESKDSPPLPTYPSGGQGPQEALTLIEREGRTWL